MSIITKIEKDYVLNIVDRKVTLENIVTYISKNVQNWEKLNTLWDLSEFNFNQLNPESVRNFVDIILPVTKIREGLKTAVVVKSQLAFGMMRMFQLISEDKSAIEINIFMNIEEGIEWLRE